MDDTRPTDSSVKASPAELLKSDELVATHQDWPGMRSRWIVPPRVEGWPGVVLSEWELERAVWTDLHHHDEFNHILEGELHVETGGTSVIARVGDTVRVPAGQLGRYTAPKYARMFAVYGPNPGRADESFSYEAL